MPGANQRLWSCENGQVSSSQTTLGRRWHLSWASNSDPVQNRSSAHSHPLSSAPTFSLPIVFSFLAHHWSELSHSEGLVRCQGGGGPGKGKQEQQGKKPGDGEKDTRCPSETSEGSHFRTQTGQHKLAVGSL